MEYVEGTTLKELINQNRQQNQFFQEDFICSLLTQIISALNHCRLLHIIHRDIKPENILITKNNIIKLMDFGTSKIVETMFQGASTQAGTTIYMSPEMINSKKYKSNSDVWSLG
jgi:NIMA (never in mitosis gene a)-related kinase